MRKLILVKHSLPRIDPSVDSREWQLSAEGQRRCERLTEILREHCPEVIVASMEPKALETGKIVAQCLNVQLETAENLHEHDRRGVPFFPEKGTFEVFVTRFLREPNELVFGNETADQAYERYAEAVDGVLQRHPVGNVAVVSHGTVMTLFVSRRINVEPVTFWRKLGLPAVVVLTVPGDELQVVLPAIDG